MKSKYPKLAPDKIESLSMCEVFVFGSNLQGHHTGGAARYAYKHFGAEWGVGIGPTGQCYAIPTMHGGVDDIRPYVEDFVKYAKSFLPGSMSFLTGRPFPAGSKRLFSMMPVPQNCPMLHFQKSG